MWTALDDSLCQLGESPFWHPHERSLYWPDIPGRAVLRTRGEIGDRPTVERWQLPTEPGCMAPAARGGLVIALRDGGDDLRTLFVTSARRGRPAEELEQRPASGQVIAMRAEVSGLPVNFFAE